MGPLWNITMLGVTTFESSHRNVFCFFTTAFIVDDNGKKRRTTTAVMTVVKIV